MAIVFHIPSENSILIGPLRDRLLETLCRASKICSSKLNLADIDVVVINDPEKVIPRIGVGGFCCGKNRINIHLDTDNQYLQVQDNFDNAIISTLAHELHHSARALVLPSSHGNTYGGGLVAEGLACCFEEEIGQQTPFYATECNGDALKLFSEKAKQNLDKTFSDLEGGWPQWSHSYENNNSKFPYQCGYSTGYALVKHWLDHTGKTASEAAGIHENVVIATWLKGEIKPFG